MHLRVPGLQSKEGGAGGMSPSIVTGIQTRVLSQVHRIPEAAPGGGMPAAHACPSSLSLLVPLS